MHPSQFDEVYFDILKSVLNICATRKRSIYVRFWEPIRSGINAHLYLWITSKQGQTVLSITKAHPWNIWKLEFYDNLLTHISELVHEGFPSLHTLVLADSGSWKMLDTIALANVENKLPNLCILDISGVRVDGRLHILLLGTFPSMTTLVLTDCRLILQDLTSLAQASVQGKLPELKHLDISFNALGTQNDPFQPLESLALYRLFSEPSLKLTSLITRGRCLNIRDLAEAGGTGKLQHFTSLDFTLNPNIAGHLSVLLYQSLSSLSVLILWDCELTSDDMRSLACASELNKLPELRHLDVSLNPIGCKSGSSGLFELLSYKFPSLAYLILCSCGLNYWDLDSLARAKLAGKLPALRYLDVSLNGLTGHLSHLTGDPRTGLKIFWDRIVCKEEGIVR